MREVGRPKGTLIEVADLFYNLPARRKFLKSDTAESAQVSRLVTQLALGYPEVGFTLTSGGRRLLECPPAARSARAILPALRRSPGPRARCASEAARHAIARLRRRARASRGPARGPQNVFVNRRIVSDRTIAHAIIEAYSVATIKERSPEVHLFIEMPPDRVDVNVHPTKAEVRFLEQSLVHEVRAARARRRARAGAGARAASCTPFPPRPGEPRAMSIPGVLAGATVGEPMGHAFVWSAHGAVSLRRRTGVERTAASVGRDARAARKAPPILRPMIPLGQFRDTFIIAMDDEGVAIIDQHVAHERVLFERVMERLTTGRLESQRLLTPILIEMSSAQRQALAQHRRRSIASGSSSRSSAATACGSPPFPRCSIPPSAKRRSAHWLRISRGSIAGSGVEDALRRIAATMACHAAVKANYPLTLEKMRHILEELRRTAYSTVCPHGRPVVLRMYAAGNREELSADRAPRSEV